VFRPGRIVRRLRRISSAGFPATHLLSLVAQLPMRRALGKARRAWEAEAGAPAAALAHPDRPAIVPVAGGATKSAHDVALGAWLCALAVQALFEVVHRQPGWSGMAGVPRGDGRGGRGAPRAPRVRGLTEARRRAGPPKEGGGTLAGAAMLLARSAELIRGSRG
jgi:hypothetical protein